MAVVPGHQGRGVGSLIMQPLPGCLHENVPDTAFVGLMAEHRTPHFHETSGFTMSSKPKPAGMFMRMQAGAKGPAPQTEIATALREQAAARDKRLL